MGSHPGSPSCEASVTSVICVSLLSVRGCQRYGRPHMFFYEWTQEGPPSQFQRGEENSRPPRTERQYLSHSLLVKKTGDTCEPTVARGAAGS